MCKEAETLSKEETLGRAIQGIIWVLEIQMISLEILNLDLALDQEILSGQEIIEKKENNS